MLASASTTLPDVSVGHLLGQMVVAIAVIGGGIWIFGKFVQRRKAHQPLLSGRRPAPGLAVLSRTSLGKDQQLAVVRWGSREVLVGITGSTITFLPDGATTAEPADEELGAALAASGLSAAGPVPIEAPDGSRPSLLDQLRAATLRS